MTEAQRDQLLALADRCEREKPTRELDARIEQAIAPDKKVLFDAGSVGPVKRRAAYGPLRDFPMDGWKGETAWDAVAGEVGARRYTTSLDAAVTLVPEGWAWFVEWIGTPFREGTARLWIPSQRTKGLHSEQETSAAETPALALCAAALRARAAVGFDEAGKPVRSHPHPKGGVDHERLANHGHGTGRPYRNDQDR